MAHVDVLKAGTLANGMVSGEPDRIVSMRIAADIAAVSPPTVEFGDLEFTGFNWAIAATGAGGVQWDGSTLHFTGQSVENDRLALEGYFDWIASSGEAGIEYFTGTLARDGSVSLTGQGFGASGAVFTYTADYDFDTRAFEGTWSGPTPGTWRATLVVPKLPDTVEGNLVLSLLELANAAYPEEDSDVAGWTPVAVSVGSGTPPTASHVATIGGIADGLGPPLANYLNAYEGVVDGERTLALAFSGSGDISDFIQQIGGWSRLFDEHRPHLDALMQWARNEGVRNILVTGHSLGGVMVEEFVDSALHRSVLGETGRLYGVTFGSPGSPKEVAIDPSDAGRIRLLNFVNVGDPVAMLTTDGFFDLLPQDAPAYARFIAETWKSLASLPESVTATLADALFDQATGIVETAPSRDGVTINIAQGDRIAFQQLDFPGRHRLDGAVGYNTFVNKVVDLYEQESAGGFASVQAWHDSGSGWYKGYALDDWSSLRSVTVNLTNIVGTLGDMLGQTVVEFTPAVPLFRQAVAFGGAAKLAFEDIDGMTATIVQNLSESLAMIQTGASRALQTVVGRIDLPDGVRLSPAAFETFLAWDAEQWSAVRDLAGSVWAEISGWDADVWRAAASWGAPALQNIAARGAAAGVRALEVADAVGDAVTQAASAAAWGAVRGAKSFWDWATGVEDVVLAAPEADGVAYHAASTPAVIAGAGGPATLESLAGQSLYLTAGGGETLRLHGGDNVIFGVPATLDGASIEGFGSTDRVELPGLMLRSDGVLVREGSAIFEIPGTVAGQPPATFRFEGDFSDARFEVSGDGPDTTIRLADGSAAVLPDGGIRYTGRGATGLRIAGGAGDDVITGTDGDDIITGGGGANLLIGGRGDDILIAGLGDTLRGGAGRDRFAFDGGLAVGPGTAVIDDFRSGEDVIVLGGFAGIADFGDLSFAVEAGSLTIGVGGDRRVVLRGIASAETVGPADFEIQPHAIRLGFVGLAEGFAVADADETIVFRGLQGVQIDTGGGNNRVLLGAGADTVIGGTGDDVILAGRGGNDLVDLRAGGNNRVTAGDGADTIIGGAGRDVIRPGRGDDLVDLRAGGDNFVFNLRGNSTILGGAGDDVIFGGIGDTLILAGGGNNRLLAGPGRDTIGFVQEAHETRLLDFRPGSDTLDFTGHDGVSGLDDLTLRQIGSNTIIDDGSGGRIVLADIAPDEIGAGDFLF